MSQTWDTPATSDSGTEAVTSMIPACLETLRSKWSGASEPSATVPYQSWLDTTTGSYKIRDSGDSAWVAIGPAASDWAERTILVAQFSALSATTAYFIAPPSADAIVRRVVVVTDNGTSSSSGNEWRFSLVNLTQASAALFSASVGTYTVLGGVGGGELVSDTTYVLIPDQNENIAANDVLELTLTEVGAITPLQNTAVWIEWSTTNV